MVQCPCILYIKEQFHVIVSFLRPGLADLKDVVGCRVLAAVLTGTFHRVERV